jgi:hypothetical protein
LLPNGVNLDYQFYEPLREFFLAKIEEFQE